MIQHSHCCFCCCCVMVMPIISDLFLSTGSVVLPSSWSEVKYPGSLGKYGKKGLSFFPRLAKSSLGLNSKLSVLLCLILTRPTFHQDLCWGHASQAQARRWHTAICLLKFCHWHPEARHGGLWCTWSTSNFIGWFCLGLGSQMSPTKLFCRDRAPERLPPATWEWYKVFLGTCLFPPAGAFFSKKRQTSLYCPSFFMVQVPAIEWATELAKHILSSRC